MKKILIIFLILFSFGCTNNKYKVVYSPSFKDDPVKLEIARKDSMEHPEKYLSTEDLEKRLDSMTAQGEYILVRGSKRNYDTIIDHVRYIYTTEE